MTNLTGGTSAARFTSVTFVAFHWRNGRGGGRRCRHRTGTGRCTLRITSSDFLSYHQGSWLVKYGDEDEVIYFRIENELTNRLRKPFKIDSRIQTIFLRLARSCGTIWTVRIRVFIERMPYSCGFTCWTNTGLAFHTPFTLDATIEEHSMPRWTFTFSHGHVGCVYVIDVEKENMSR